MILTDYIQNLQLKRVNALNGLMIDRDAWNDSHEYHRIQQQLHSVALHTPGIVTGFEVVAEGAAQRPRALIVFPGIGVDELGRVIVIPRFLRHQVQTMVGGNVYLVVKYKESYRDIALIAGEDSPTRIYEGAVVEEWQELPSDPHIEIARINLTAQAKEIRNPAEPRNPAPDEIDMRFRLLARPRPMGTISIGQVQYVGTTNKDSWAVHWGAVDNLVNEINQGSQYQAIFAGPVSLMAPVTCTALYMSGNSGFSLSPQEEKNLQDFLDAGGTLIGDGCRAGKGGKGVQNEFAASFNGLSVKMGREMAPVVRPHAMLSSCFNFAMPPDGLYAASPILERLGVCYLAGDYGCVWLGGGADQPMMRSAMRDTYEMGANIAAYAYQQQRLTTTRGYR